MVKMLDPQGETNTIYNEPVKCPQHDCYEYVYPGQKCGCGATDRTNEKEGK